MSVTIEQNIAVRNSIRNDLRYIKPGVPTRYTFKRGAWRPTTYKSVIEIPAPEPGAVPPVVPPEYEEITFRETAIISIATAAVHEIVPGSPGRRIRLFDVIFTVAGDVNVTFYEGALAISGAMDFGGVSEPRGIVIPFNERPLLLDESRSFGIGLSAAVQVSGIVQYRYIDQ